MKLKRIEATSLPEALARVERECGKDALVVETKTTRQGYVILPVSPKLEEWSGIRCVSKLADLEARPDLVDLFRAPAHLPAHAEEILALKEPPRAVWMQLGIQHAEVTQRLEEAGIAVVENRCLMVEHGRLLGAGRSPEGSS